MSPQTSSPTAVLAHGAWADGSSWGPVITGLKQAGIAAIAAPIPLTTLADDIKALDRTIDRTEGPVIVVGHAYAGGVIAASKHPRIRALVYVAALAPDEGETVAEVFNRDPSHPDAPKLAPDDEGWIWLPLSAFPKAFAQQATADQQAILAAVQRPMKVDCIQQPVPRPRWKDHPSWFLVAEEDRMINATTQKFMAERMHANVHTHDADHVPMITRTQAVVDIIAEAARDVG